MEDEVRIITEFAWTDLPDSTVEELESEEGIVVPPGYPLLSKAIAVVPIDVDGTVVDIVALHTIPLLRGSPGTAAQPR